MDGKSLSRREKISKGKKGKKERRRELKNEKKEREKERVKLRLLAPFVVFLSSKF